MNALKITTRAMNASPNASPASGAKAPFSAALALGLLGALFALTPPAIGQVQAGQNHATDLSETQPIPTRIVPPKVGLNYVGTRVEMTFWIDKAGIPYSVGSLDLTADHDLVSQLSLAIDFWRFVPARDADGNPVARRVSLPVTILAPKEGTEALVAFGYKK